MCFVWPEADYGYVRVAKFVLVVFTIGTPYVIMLCVCCALCVEYIYIHIRRVGVYPRVLVNDVGKAKNEDPLSPLRLRIICQ